MPVEIVNSNPQTGEILESGLRKMKNDFIEQADVKPYNGRTRLIKKYSVSVNVDEFKNLIKLYEDDPTKGIDVITINFAIHLNPGPDECPGFDYSDSLTVIAEAAKFIDSTNPRLGFISQINIGDFVVIPAYPSSEKHGWSKNPCCPSSNP